MLNSLDIRYFQTHKSTVIDFHPGLNVITGISSHGKTSIIRDLIWALNNRPSGGKFKSWFAKDSDIVETSLEFDNGWFTKQRIKDKNIYICDAGKFEALRSDVPETIQEISNMQDYNILTQHEPFFMLQATPGDRAKKLNELVGLDIIDQVFKKINKKISDTKSEIKTVTTEIASLEEEIESFSYLTSTAIQVSKLDADINQYEVSCQRARQIASLLQKLSDINLMLATFADIAKHEQQYLELKKKVISFQKQELTCYWISEHINKLKNVENSLESWQEVLTVEPVYNKLISLIGNYKEQTEIVDWLIAHLKALVNIEETLQADIEWLTIEEPFNKLQSDLAHYNIRKIRCDDIKRECANLEGLERQIKGKQLILDGAVIKYAALLEKEKVCPICKSVMDINKITGDLK